MNAIAERPIIFSAQYWPEYLILPLETHDVTTKTPETCRQKHKSSPVLEKYLFETKIDFSLIQFCFDDELHFLARGGVKQPLSNKDWLKPF